MESSSVKNITVALLVVTFIFAGYYFFVQKDSIQLASDGSVSQELFTDVQRYIERRQILDEVTLDTTLLANPRFTALSGFPRTQPEQPVTRENPFDEVNPQSGFSAQ